MKTSEAAYKAAEYMAEHGHCKGALSDDEGRVCFLGSLRAVAPMGNLGYMNEEYFIVKKAWELGYTVEKNGYHSIPCWNDAPERTGEDVILALKHVGAELEAEGK